MKIYTKTGDQGETSLIGGARVKKFDPRLEAYGTVDELNSHIGVLRSDLSQQPGLIEVDRFLHRVQHQLFKIGSQLACEDEEMREKLPKLESEVVQEIESEIDRLESELPELKSFILPGGSRLASLCHVCRTVCRRAERRTAVVKDPTLEQMGIFLFLNRLSDYFFVLARTCNQVCEVADVPWDQKV
ncbi:MAG: cob(I)yrinic acid a,c-diamide adenosyltransferase [Pseudomonadota bacterium]